MGNCCNIREQKAKHLGSNNNREAIEVSLRLKEQGNLLIREQQYLNAIIAYTEAINMYEDSIYYSNRAVAYRATNQMELAKQDSIKALFLDNCNARAHFTLGSLLLIDSQQECSLNLHEKGMEHLSKAEILGKGREQLVLNVVNNLKMGIRLKKILEKQLKKQMLIRKLRKLDIHGKIDFEWIIHQYEQEQEQEQENNQAKFEYLNCVITQEIMKEPVLMESGHTYERIAIMQSIKLNGGQDPNTRQNIEIMIPNIHLIQMIESNFDNIIEFQ